MAIFNKVWKIIFETFLLKSFFGKEAFNQCDQIGQFIGLWASFKALGSN